MSISKNMWRTGGRLNFPLNGLALYAPLWHPELNVSPFISKDLNAYSYTITGTTWGVQGRTFDGTDDIFNNSTTAFQLPVVTITGWFYANSVQTQGDLTVGVWSYGGALTDLHRNQHQPCSFMMI